MGWFDSSEAITAGNTLADRFPKQVSDKALVDFLNKTTTELQALKLNVYKRVRFAAAFKMRLLEKGVPEQQAGEITNTLLARAAAGPDTPPAAAPEPVAEAAAATEQIKPVGRGDAVLGEADRAFASGDAARAAELFQQYLAKHPKHADTRYNLALALYASGQPEPAEEQLRQAIALKSRFPQAITQLGFMQLNSGRFPAAEGNFRRALKMNPADPFARSNLGVAFIHLGRLPAAREELEKVLNGSPRNAEALYGMGLLTQAEGQIEQAEGFFKQALQSSPNMARAWAALPKLRTMTSADKDWLRDAERVLATTPFTTDRDGLQQAIDKYHADVGTKGSARR